MVRAALLAVCVLGAAAPAVAQSYPTRTVEIIVPFAAGGGNDLLARMIGEGLGKRLGQSFVPLNRPGANTNNGTLQVVKSAPDGHTLLISSVGLAANPSLYKRLPFNHADRSRADHADRELADHPGGAERAAGEHACGVRRLPEGAARRAQLCILRRRIEPASCDRAVPVDDRHQGRARALSRRRPGVGRRHGQQRADAVLQRPAGAGPGAWRPAQADRDRGRPALAVAAGRADLRRKRASTTVSARGSGCWRRRRRRTPSSQC